MAERGWGIAQLHRALMREGILRDRSNVTRLVGGEVKGLPLDVLHALCSIFACTPNDLLLPQPEAASVDEEARRRFVHDLAMELDLARYEADHATVAFEDVVRVVPSFIRRCSEKRLAHFYLPAAAAVE